MTMTLVNIERLIWIRGSHVIPKSYNFGISEDYNKKLIEYQTAITNFNIAVKKQLSEYMKSI